jgi:threonine/homoserine/homoserine lactone efflux protein
MNAAAWAWLASVLAFATAMSATPGPNNTMLAASGATWGMRRTVSHMLGVAIGFPVMIVAVALGAAGALRTWPWIEGALRWIGAAYLLWLAWHIATARPDIGGAPLETDRRRPLTFVQAAMFQWVNPKAWVIAVSAITTYTSAGRGSLVAQALALAGAFLVVTLPTTVFWTAVGVGAARALRTPARLRGFNLALAALLVASLLPLLKGEG